MPVQLHLTTPDHPGPVALIQARGETASIIALLTKLTHTADWKPGIVRLVSFAEIDRGLAVVLPVDDHLSIAQLMPHGGVRVVRLILDQLLTAGATYDASPDPQTIYPEASDPIEADMLSAIAQASSPAAIDLLLAQPDLWNTYLKSPVRADEKSAITTRTRILDRLIVPPLVVVMGRPNVGKSTLANRITGRAHSIVADLPGTTRDWVAGLAELPPGVAVRWIDTPGLRSSKDVIEQQAIELARSVIASADVRIVVRDGQIDWPEPESLAPTPDLWVVNKADQCASPMTDEQTGTREHPIRISAQTGAGIDRLAHGILQHLGLAEAIKTPALWAFSSRLKQHIAKG